MSIWDSITQVAKDAAELASKAGSAIAEGASSAYDATAEFASKAGDAIVEGASAAGQKSAEWASSAYDATAEFASSAYDSVAEFTSLKIKGALQSLDLQSTIDSLNQYQKEKGTDVSVLTNFITRLKEFSEDGK